LTEPLERIGERALLRPFPLSLKLQRALRASAGREWERGRIGEWDVAIRVISVVTKFFASPFFDEGIRGSGDLEKG